METSFETLVLYLVVDETYSGPSVSFFLGKMRIVMSLMVIVKVKKE